MNHVPIPCHSAGSTPRGARRGRASVRARSAAAAIDLGIVLAVTLLIDAVVATSAGMVVAILASAAYTTIFDGGPAGQTIGKMAYGNRVVDERTGRPIGHLRALQRWLAAVAGLIAVPLVLLWILVDDERATWYDRLSDTIVVATAD